MRLADVELALDLKRQLAELEEWHGPAALRLADRDIELDADAVAAYVDYRRSQIERELYRLGIDTKFSREPERPPAHAEDDRAPAAAAEVEVGGDAVAVHHRVPPILSHAEARERATRNVMGAAWDDWKAGRYDDPGAIDPAAAGDAKFWEMASRRSLQIDAVYAAMLDGEPVRACEHCPMPATSVVAGHHLCDEHARTTRRLPLPQAFRRIFSQ